MKIGLNFNNISKPEYKILKDIFIITTTFVSMFIETIFHHSLLNPRRAGTEEFYHILLVALEVLPWSEDDTFLSFQGTCRSLVEAVECRELSSSVLLDGTSKA